jgi:hypothetical protein
MVSLILAVVDQKETYWSLLHNAPHWEFEFTVEVVTAIPSFFIGRWFVERHDKLKHKKSHSNEIKKS